jgi:hypothetical protein
LRWKGSLRVLDVTADGVAVEFNAESHTAFQWYERYIHDRTVLSFDQFRDWTGVDARLLLVVKEKTDD